MTHIAKVYKFSIKNKSNRYGRNKMGNKIINALMLFDSFRFVYKRCIFPTLDVGKKITVKNSHISNDSEAVGAPEPSMSKMFVGEIFNPVIW